MRVKGVFLPAGQWRISVKENREERSQLQLGDAANSLLHKLALKPHFEGSRAANHENATSEIQTGGNPVRNLQLFMSNLENTCLSTSSRTISKLSLYFYGSMILHKKRDSQI